MDDTGAWGGFGEGGVEGVDVGRGGMAGEEVADGVTALKGSGWGGGRAYLDRREDKGKSKAD